MRRTDALARVCAAILERPGQQWGYDLVKRSGVRSGVLYPVLARMEVEGWLRSEWDESRPSGARRRYYVVTNEQAVRAHAAPPTDPERTT